MSTARVAIGVLGAARIAPRALIEPARLLPEADVVAVAARDPARARSFAEKHGIPKVHDNYEALLHDSEIDAVYNPLPNGLHGAWTLAALEAGKHVICEKPFTANAAEAEAVGAATAQAGKVVMEAFHYRYHPLMARVLEIVGDGTLGPIRHVATRMLVVVPNRRDIRYRLDLAGGAVMDVGCYAIHQLRTIAGAEPAVTRAEAVLASPGVDRVMDAEFRFDDGRTGSMSCALIARRVPVTDIRVSGENGLLRVVNPTRPQTLGSLTVRTADGSKRRERVRGQATFWYQLQAFCAAVLRGEETLTPPADAIANMRAIDGVYEAAGLAPRQPSA
jgi:predicted dehydrogenase